VSAIDNTPAEATPTGQPRRRRTGSWDGFSRYGAVLVLWAALFIVLSVTQPHFFTKNNIEVLLTGTSILWIVAMGMTFVVITAGIDLSAGASVALVGIFLAKLINLGLPGGVVVPLCILFGAAVGGGLNGVLIGRFRLSFFVVTLGTMEAITGAVSIWSKTETTYVNSSLVNALSINNLLGIPTAIWIMALVWVIALYVQRRTYFGRDVYAVGGNIEAARLSGIRVPRTLIAAYAIVGAAAGLAGVIQVGRIGAASPDVGTDIALDAAAGVLLGGTSFLGGVGGVNGTAVGVIFIGTLQNGLGIAGVSSFWQQVVTGVILIAAVSIDRIRQNGNPLGRRRAAAADATEPPGAPPDAGDTPQPVIT
jgi:ribose transport system permease protein